jgi:hypothetical protein
VGRDSVAPVVGLALRFALNAPPCGLRRAVLRSQANKLEKTSMRRSTETGIVVPRAC